MNLKSEIKSIETKYRDVNVNKENLNVSVNYVETKYQDIYLNKEKLSVSVDSFNCLDNETKIRDLKSLSGDDTKKRKCLIDIGNLYKIMDPSDKKNEQILNYTTDYSSLNQGSQLEDVSSIVNDKNTVYDTLNSEQEFFPKNDEKNQTVEEKDDSKSSIFNRRARFKYTKAQLRRFEEVFNANIFPDSATREKIAKDMNIPSRNIQVWFKNRRAKQRKVANTYNIAINHPSIYLGTHENIPYYGYPAGYNKSVVGRPSYQSYINSLRMPSAQQFVPQICDAGAGNMSFYPRGSGKQIIFPQGNECGFTPYNEVESRSLMYNPVLQRQERKPHQLFPNRDLQQQFNNKQTIFYQRHNNVLQETGIKQNETMDNEKDGQQYLNLQNYRNMVYEKENNQITKATQFMSSEGYMHPGNPINTNN